MTVVATGGVVTRTIAVTNHAGEIVVTLDATDVGSGLVKTFQPNGKPLVELSASDNGGVIQVFNKTVEPTDHGRCRRRRETAYAAARTPHCR